MSAQICATGSCIRRRACALGMALRGLASACIDVSDGLAADAREAVRRERLRRGDRRGGAAGLRALLGAVGREAGAASTR